MDKWHEAASGCIENGKRLLEDADFIEVGDRSSTAFALAVVAQEEFAKAFLFHLIGTKSLPANPLVLRIAKDHSCKQLLGLVMDYVNPDTDDFAATLKLVFDDRAAGRLRRDVADALNILRHEKVGRWKSKTWFWNEDPLYDPSAKSVADGSIDREKQDSLYVRVGSDGRIVSTPACVQPKAARDAIGRAHRFGQLMSDVLAADPGALVDYDRIKDVFEHLFADLDAANGEGVNRTV
jgi:AbiV family abortive infection protein